MLSLHPRTIQPIMVTPSCSLQQLKIENMLLVVDYVNIFVAVNLVPKLLLCCSCGLRWPCLLVGTGKMGMHRVVLKGAGRSQACILKLPLGVYGASQLLMPHQFRSRGPPCGGDRVWWWNWRGCGYTLCGSWGMLSGLELVSSCSTTVVYMYYSDCRVLYPTSIVGVIHPSSVGSHLLGKGKSAF